MDSYVYDVRSVPALIGLLIYLLRGTSATSGSAQSVTSGAAQSNTPGSAPSSTWPAAITIAFLRSQPNRAQLTFTDLETLFSPLVAALRHAVSCTVRVTWSYGATLRCVKHVQWYRAARPFPDRDLGVVLRPGPRLDQDAADAARPTVVPALEVECWLLA